MSVAGKSLAGEVLIFWERRLKRRTEMARGPGRRHMGPRPKVKNPGKVFMRILGYVGKNHMVKCIAVLICIFISVFANVQGTLFTKTLIDDYITPLLGNNNPDFAPLMKSIIRVSAFYACGIAANLAQHRLLVYINQGTLKNLRNDMFEHMERLPVKYFDTHLRGDIMSIYTNDIDTLRQMISQSMPQCINSVITIVSVLISMFVLSVPLTILTLVMVGITIILSKKMASLSSKNYVAQQKDIGDLNGYIEEMMNGQKVIKVFNYEKRGIKRFSELNDRLYESAYKATKFANVMGPINAQIGNLSYVLCAVAGGAMALGGWGGLTLGRLASFLTFNKNFSMPVNHVSMQVNFIFMAIAGAERIFALLDEEVEPDEGYVTLVNARYDGEEIVECEERTGMWAWKHYHKAEGNITYTKQEGDVIFGDVCFSYIPEKQVLKNIKMFAAPGQKIALVGSTGAGKTTITNLINRFYDIDSGKLRYDGINISKIKKDDLRRSLGIVLQETHLFTGTVADNIRFGKLDATDREVIAAAKLANADGFIRQLPKGYDTMLTGDGASLSQGQRQLLSIARAAIADPPVLILDEATSSIDTRTERIVQEGMDKLMKGRTVFVIAHRLSTIMNSDCIMVMEHGEIIERGRHEELLEKKGKYYKLFTGATA